MSVLSPNSHTPVDASGGAVPMTLPTGQLPGTEISVEKFDTSVNVVTVTGNLRGVAAQTLTLSLPHQAVTFRADAAGSWWPTAGHITKTSLDQTYAPFGPAAPDHTRTPIWIDTGASVPVIRYWDGTAWTAIPGGGGVGSGFLITDNGDGTATVTPTGTATVVDNGDGTATLTGGSVTDNGDGTAVIAA